jgi:hypothetical protein
MWPVHFWVLGKSLWAGHHTSSGFAYTEICNCDLPRGSRQTVFAVLYEEQYGLYGRTDLTSSGETNRPTACLWEFEKLFIVAVGKIWTKLNLGSLYPNIVLPYQYPRESEEGDGWSDLIRSDPTKICNLQTSARLWNSWSSRRSHFWVWRAKNRESRNVTQHLGMSQRISYDDWSQWNCWGFRAVCCEVQ